MQIINEETALTDIRQLKPHPRNPNIGNVDAITESIEQNGFYGSIIAQRSTGYILAGHHRLQAAVANGALKIPVTWVDIGDTQALKILLADNRIAELAHRDEEILASLLSELQLTDDLAGTGYIDADLDALIAGMSDNSDSEMLAMDESYKLGQNYQIIITLVDEEAQVKMLDRFMTEGIVCRALIS